MFDAASALASSMRSCGASAHGGPVDVSDQLPSASEHHRV
jgi:hypothetical protein